MEMRTKLVWAEIVNYVEFGSLEPKQKEIKEKLQHALFSDVS